MQIPLHDAVLRYFCGMDPAMQWKAWGARGSHVDGEIAAVDALKNEDSLVQERMKEPGVQAKLNEFATEVQRLLNAFLANDAAVKAEYLDNKKFIFVCGIMRSGGTYIFQELSTCLGIDWRARSFPMSHDIIPTYGLVMHHHNPQAAYQLLLEICQFLAWAKREGATEPFVIQKRIAYAHGIPFVESVFGPSVEYVVTIRHPGSACTSFSEMEGIDEEAMPAQAPGGWKEATLMRTPRLADWDALDLRHQYLWFWRTYYMDVARSGMATDRIHALVYGEAFPQFVRAFGEQEGKTYEPRPFTPRKRDYHPFWSSDEVGAVIDEVGSFWRLCGKDFGNLGEIL